MKKFSANIEAIEFFKLHALQLVRRLYLLLIIGATLQIVISWYYLIHKSDWTQEQKQKYINEQAFVSFNKDSYQKALEILEKRKEKLQHYKPYEGRDVFFPPEFENYKIPVQ